MLQANMVSINDQEGTTVPDHLSFVVDAHVHIFPQTIFSAVWKWFAEHAWPVRYQLYSKELLDFLFSRGVQHIVALQYAHKPGIAVELNSYMAKICTLYKGRVTGMATVFPGEENDVDILQQAFNKGLSGLKLHAHVQCFDMVSDEMQQLYECCQRNRKPIIMHVGREPASSAYDCNPYDLCDCRKLENILFDHPKLNICVPHLGFDEVESYKRLIETYDNLWLDTTMVITDYFPVTSKVDLRHYRSNRIMYGSDFPNIPYAWDRELKVLAGSGLNPNSLLDITCKSAVDFFGLHHIDVPSLPSLM